MSTLRSTAVLGVLLGTFGLVACGGGGGGGGGSSDADTSGPTIGSASDSLQKMETASVYRSIQATITDPSGVASAEARVTGPGGYDQTVALVASGSTYSGQVQVQPPIIDSESYDYTITATDGAGNQSSLDGSFTMDGNSGPATGSAFQ